MHLSEIIQRTYRLLCNKFFPNNSSLTIITAASDDFYETLTNNLLDSISHFEPKANIIVWNLGLSEQHIQELLKNYPQINLKHFGFTDYPNHYVISAQSYAWKSAAIYESYNGITSDIILWLDAGCKLKGHLNAVRHIIRRHGFYCPFSRTTIQELTYPSVLQDFRLIFPADAINEKRMLSAASIGFKVSSHLANSILWEWYQLSKIPELIVPNGSNRSNHRQDQSLLSLIYYYNKKRVPLLAQRVYDFLLHQR